MDEFYVMLMIINKAVNAFMPTYFTRGTFLKLSDNSPSLLSIIQTSSSVLLTVLTIRVKKLETY